MIRYSLCYGSDNSRPLAIGSGDSRSCRRAECRTVALPGGLRVTAGVAVPRRSGRCPKGSRAAFPEPHRDRDVRVPWSRAHLPAEYVRRPAVPAESPTLGFTHLQFEALLTAARHSAHPCDFALVAMLGLLGLRIFGATGADIPDLGEEHGHRVPRVCGKGTKVVLRYCRTWCADATA